MGDVQHIQRPSLSRPFIRDLHRPRMMLALKSLADDPSGIGTAVAQLYPEARIRVSASEAGPAEAAMAKEKGYDRAAFVIDVEWPSSLLLMAVRWQPESLSQLLGTRAGVMTILAGAGHILLDEPGAYFMLIAAKRADHLSAGQFHQWWIGDHADLIEELCPDFANAYVQLHAHRGLGRDLAKNLNIAYRPLDGADSVYFDDAEKLFSSVGTPETARRFAEDEARAVDVAAGGICMVGKVVFDSQTIASGASVA